MSPDEVISIELRNGRMEAFPLVKSGLLSEQLTVEMCIALAKAEGIALTSDVERAIRELVDQYNTDPSQSVEVTIARGHMAEHGRDGYLEWVDGFDPESDPALTTEITEEPVDYYKAQSYITVEEGQHIATVIPPTDGADGLTVEGTLIQAAPGKQYKLRSDGSISHGEGGRVVANRSGLLLQEGCSLKVLDMLNIEGYVDFNTGHIEFDGSVTIQRGIRDRFRVNCTGDLHVRGLIEAAEVITGGDATFERGMAAREKGTVCIGHDLKARYLDNVLGSVQRDLIAEKEVVNCELHVGRSLCIERGALVGGEITVGTSVECEVIGSDAGVCTRLSLGVFPKLLKIVDQIGLLRKKAQKELEKAQNENDTLVANAGKLNPSQRERLTELQFEVGEYQRRISLLDAKKEEIEEMIKQYGRVDVKVTKRIYAGTILTLRQGSAAMRSDIKGPVRIHLNDRNQPVITDLTTGTTSDLMLVAEVEDEGSSESDASSARNAA